MGNGLPDVHPFTVLLFAGPFKTVHATVVNLVSGNLGVDDEIFQAAETLPTTGHRSMPWRCCRRRMAIGRKPIQVGNIG